MTKEEQDAVAAGIGQFVLAFYQTAPAGSRLTVTRELRATLYESSCAIGATRSRWFETVSQDDRKTVFAIIDGGRMGERLARAASPVAGPK